VKTAYDRIANARQVSEAVVNGMRRWIDALWPLTLLSALAAAYHDRP